MEKGRIENVVSCAYWQVEAARAFGCKEKTERSGRRKPWFFLPPKRGEKPGAPARMAPLRQALIDRNRGKASKDVR